MKALWFQVRHIPARFGAAWQAFWAPPRTLERELAMKVWRNQVARMDAARRKESLLWLYHQFLECEVEYSKLKQQVERIK